jgi:probable F420-dependent oxidoreductase
MQIGAIFPQIEIGSDPAAIRDYAQAVEDLGYGHITAYDHVLGASTANRPNWSGPYTSKSMFHEIFVLFGYLAALTRHVQLMPGVLILPQRQTALVAKQAAEIDVLSGGRLLLGVGVGWNDVEFEALGEDFHTRGARIEEQIAVLRALWTQPIVDFHGRWHHIPEAGINPLPVQQPIPIWMGGTSDVVLRRMAHLADGWLPQRRPDEKARLMLDQLRAYTRAAGRPEDAVGIQARLSIGQVPQTEWAAYAGAWEQLGAMRLDVNTMGAGLATPQDHIAALRRVKDTLGAKDARGV